jgi:gliding-associated putative ABC transporter substrate-binding component GldG
MKNFFKKSNNYLTILIIIAILACINLVSYKLSFRIDMSENNDFSISKASKEAIKDLDDIVNIKVYFSDDLPARFITLKQEIGDILSEYENYSNKKIKVNYLDPNEMEERDLYMLGIPALQFNVLEKDKYQVVKGYLGMSIEYGNKKEVISVVESTESFEYRLTLAIKKVISEEMASIAFYAEEKGEYSVILEELKKIYSVSEPDLKSENDSFEFIDVLILADIKEDLGEEVLKKIDEFVVNGGKLMLISDGVVIEQGLIPSANQPDLYGLLENYGIKINNDLVLDERSGIASFSTGFFNVSINYPFWPKIEKSGFNQNISAVSGLETIILPWVSSLNKVEGKNIIMTDLVNSSSKSWKEKDNFDLNPQRQFSSSSYESSVLAALYEGEFKSIYGAEESDKGEIIVVADSEFPRDNFINQSPDNLIFFQNLVDSLGLDEDLIKIRSKGISERPIKELDDSWKTTIRYLNVFGITILVIVFGVTRYFIRRRRG